MFDDQPINNTGSVPNNLPIGEPEDIFSQIDGGEDVAPTVDLPPAGSATPPEEISQPVSPPEVMSRPSAREAGILQPPTKQIAEPPISQMSPARGPVLSQGLMIVVISLVALAIVGGGGWWVYHSFISPPKDFFPQTEVNVDNSVPVETSVENNSSSTQNNNTTPEQVDNSVLFGEQVDSDDDQLSDDKERELGTDPNNWDSDADGLGDGDEALVWKTNPLNPDTDGDTYLDGAEVKNGYNPLGPGKLFNVSTQ